MSPFAWVAPRMWGLHLLLVASVVFTVLMGLWQLGVYDSQQADAASQEQSAKPVRLDEVLGPDQAFPGDALDRPVTVRGSYAPSGKQFWVSGRTHDGRVGYWLVAPFLVDGTSSGSGAGQQALLVVRGWSPDHGDLPATPGGAVELNAVLEPGEERSGELGADRTTSTIRIPMLVNELPYNLYSGYAILTRSSPAGDADLARVEPPSADPSWTVGWRNLAYAVQWWVFGGFAVFMWWRMGSEMVANGRRRHDGGGDDPDRVRAERRGEDVDHPVS